MLTEPVWPLLPCSLLQFNWTLCENVINYLNDCKVRDAYRLVEFPSHGPDVHCPLSSSSRLVLPRAPPLRRYSCSIACLSLVSNSPNDCCFDLGPATPQPSRDRLLPSLSVRNQDLRAQAKTLRRRKGMCGAGADLTSISKEMRKSARLHGGVPVDARADEGEVVRIRPK